jgi:tape measure domain-containing protein
VIDGQKVESTFERIGQRGDKALDKITHATRPASRGLKDVDAAVRVLNNTLRQAAGLMGVYVGLSSAMQGLRSVADTGMAFEGLNNALLAVAGSSSAATAELGYIEQESERLGLNLATTAQAYLQLAAASKGTNLQGQATREIFTAVAEASTVLQLSADQTSGALRAIGQIMSKGKVQAEELRGQLGERLYGAFQLAARGMGITTMELDKMLEQGQLIADEFLPRFADEIQRTFSDGVAVASKSARAELNRFNNSVLEIERQIAANGFLEGITDGLRGLTATLKDPAVLQAVADLGEALGVAIKGAANALGFLVRNADLAVTAVGGLVIARTAAAAFAGLNTVLATNGTIVGLKAVADLSTGLAVRLAVLQGATSLATVAMRGFGAALAFVGGPVGLAVLAGVALYKMASGHDAASKAARDHADELAELKAAVNEAAEGVEALIMRITMARSARGR